MDVKAVFVDTECKLTVKVLFTAPKNCTTPPEITCVFLVEKGVTVSRDVDSEGCIYSCGFIYFKKGKYGPHIGNLTAVDYIRIRKGRTINGDVTAGGELQLFGDPTITGVTAENAPVPCITLCSFSFSAGGDKIEVPKNGSLAKPPGSYGKVKIKASGRLELSSGVYFMSSLNVDKNSVLSLNVSGGPITLNIVGKVSFGKNSEVEIVPSGEFGTTEVTFNNLKKGTLKIGRDSTVLGNIIAPKPIQSKHNNCFCRTESRRY